MKFIYVSDLFIEDIHGGGEVDDHFVINYLHKKGHEIKRIKCTDLHEDLIKNYLDYNWIIGNFVSLTESAKNLLSRVQYVIFEHDHKYCLTRDPSPYSNFRVPKSMIVNKSFYKNAKTVFCHSKIHKNVLKENLGLDNVRNIGVSFWTDEEFEWIEKCLGGHRKSGKALILDSDNKVKGTKQTIEACKSAKLEYDLLPKVVWKDLIVNMAQHDIFAFIPQVLESYSRTIMEAKMLGCKVLTKPGMIGVASEDYFTKSGRELIQTLKARRDTAVEMIENAFQTGQEGRTDITAILTCYRRPHLLKEQVEALRAQTIKPKEIWLWVNHHADNIGFDFQSVGADRIFNCNHNWKYLGRFASAFLAQTAYIAVFDDDTISGNKWFENCIKCDFEKPGIYGSAGVVLYSDNYFHHSREGWANPKDEIVNVDLVGHAWFFKKEYLKYLWMEEPHTYETGEDIHLSYTAQKYGGIKTYTPPHPSADKSQWGSIKGYEYGVDEVASSHPSKHEDFYRSRNEMVKEYIRKGWRTVKNG